MIIHFEYCPILGLKWWVIKEFIPKKKYGRKETTYKV